MSFLFSSPWRCDALSLYSSINPAYGLPMAPDCPPKTESEEVNTDLDDQIFGRNVYSPNPTSFGDVMDSPCSSDSSDNLDSPSSFIIGTPPPEPEPFWLAGIDQTAFPIEDSYPQLEAPVIPSVELYKIESLFEDEADRGIHVLDMFSRESSVEVPLADSIGSALFNIDTHKASNYYLQTQIPPSPLSSINSSLPSPASSVQSLSDIGELPSPISSGMHPPLSPSGESDFSSSVSQEIHPLSPSWPSECPRSLSLRIDYPLSPPRRLPPTPSSPTSSLTTNQSRRPRTHTRASSPPCATFPRIQPYQGELPVRLEPPVRGKVMSDRERRTIVTVLLATRSFGEWDFAQRGLPPLEKEVVSTPKARKCGEGRRSQTSSNEIWCIIPGCGANLTALHNLKSHISSHYGVRDWVCTVCKSCFSHSGSLARHKKEFCTAEERQGLSRKRNSRRRKGISKELEE